MIPLQFTMYYSIITSKLRVITRNLPITVTNPRANQTHSRPITSRNIWHRRFGVKGTVIDWFDSYLADRTQDIPAWRAAIRAISSILFGATRFGSRSRGVYCLYRRPYQQSPSESASLRRWNAAYRWSPDRRDQRHDWATAAMCRGNT